MILHDRWAAASSYTLRFLNLATAAARPACSTATSSSSASLLPRRRPHAHRRRRRPIPTTPRFPPRTTQLPSYPSGLALLALRSHEVRPLSLRFRYCHLASFLDNGTKVPASTPIPSRFRYCHLASVCGLLDFFCCRASRVKTISEQQAQGSGRYHELGCQLP
jgi:hypothetical protein